MPHILGFSIRSSGRDLNAVRRPVRVVAPVVVAKADRSEATKADLIAEAEARGLDTSGNKPDILARLEASDG